MQDLTRLILRRFGIAALGVSLILIWAGLFGQMRDYSDFMEATPISDYYYYYSQQPLEYGFFSVVQAPLTDDQCMMLYFGYCGFVAALVLVLTLYRELDKQIWIWVSVGATLLLFSYPIARRVLVDGNEYEASTYLAIQLGLAEIGVLGMIIALSFIRFDKSIEWVYLAKRVGAILVGLAAFGGSLVWLVAGYCYSHNYNVKGGMQLLCIVLALGCFAGVLIVITEFFEKREGKGDGLCETPLHCTASPHVSAV